MNTLDTTSIVDRINAGSNMQLTGADYLCKLQRRINCDAIIAAQEQQAHCSRRAAVIGYCIASFVAIAAMLIAANGLFVH